MSYLLKEDKQPENIVAIQNQAYYLPEVSQTFHGRDIFAPVAAHLSLGVPLADIGPPVRNLVRFPIPTLEVFDDKLTGRIIKIDSFGNAITNISEDVLVRLNSASTKEPSNYEITVGSVRLKGLNRAYAESEVGESLAIIGSSGMLEIAVNGGSAEEILGLKHGDTVTIHRAI